MSQEQMPRISRWPEGVGPAERADSRPAGSPGGVRPHVCFVAMNIYPVLSGSTSVELAGGAEVQQAVLAKAFLADGFRVSMLTSDHGQPELVECGGVRIHRVAPARARGFKGLRFIHPHMTDVVAGLARIDPDVVYFRAAGFRVAAAAWYARSRGKRFVYACASDLELQRNTRWPSTRRDVVPFRMGLHFADRVLVQNIRQKELLKETFGRDGLIFPNCYMEPDAGLASAAGHVLWVGTVKTIKSPERFLELARQYPEREFTMVGGADNQNDPDKTYFRRIGDMAAAVPNLRFVGYVPFPQVGKYFDNASLFVNTSDAEGFPNTFLQAWIRGTPTVSFVRPEVILGQTGTTACRDMNELMLRVGELMGDDESWQAASAACSAHFNTTHSIAAVLPRYRDLFEQLKSPRSSWA